MRASWVNSKRERKSERKRSCRAVRAFERLKTSEYMPSMQHSLSCSVSLTGELLFEMIKNKQNFKFGLQVSQSKLFLLITTFCDFYVEEYPERIIQRTHRHSYPAAICGLCTTGGHRRSPATTVWWPRDAMCWL